MRFSQDAWQRNLALYHKTLALPFNQELAQGTLSKAAFAHYVIQDSHYLIAYGRALAVCAAKAFDADDIIQFADAAKIAIVVERTLHDSFMQEFDISKQEFENTPLTPCLPSLHLLFSRNRMVRKLSCGIGITTAMFLDLCRSW